MFPRREFTKEDYGKKLLELELAPSASVVLLPVGVALGLVCSSFCYKHQYCYYTGASSQPLEYLLEFCSLLSLRHIAKLV